MAVGVNNAGCDGPRPAAVVEDGSCFCEREAFVCALDEDFDGGGAGAGGEFFVFAGELVPVFAFGCGGGWWVSMDGSLRGGGFGLDGGMDMGWTTYYLAV